jgi:hypothetical protein
MELLINIKLDKKSLELKEIIEDISRYLIHNYNVDGTIYNLKPNALPIPKEIIKESAKIEWNPSIKEPEKMTQEEYNKTVDNLAKLFNSK